jgi:hypothetical protein
VDLYQLLIRWNINPKAFLQFNYTVQVLERDERSDALTLIFNLRL